MEETVERVTERHAEKTAPVKHFYRSQYQISGGDGRTIYYARFKDWRGKHRTFPLGSEPKTAREQLMIYEARNIRREDFDLDKKNAESEPERLSVARYLPRFLETKRALPSCGFWKSCCTHIERHVGPIALDEITRSKIAEYKQPRLTEPISRHGNPVEGSMVRSSTVNRELMVLIGLLNLAAEDGLLEKIPATRRLKDSEDHLARERIGR
jgi:hypothetical protein